VRPVVSQRVSRSVCTAAGPAPGRRAPPPIAPITAFSPGTSPPAPGARPGVRLLPPWQAQQNRAYATPRRYRQPRRIHTAHTDTPSTATGAVPGTQPFVVLCPLSTRKVTPRPPTPQTLFREPLGQDTRSRDRAAGVTGQESDYPDRPSTVKITGDGLPHSSHFFPQPDFAAVDTIWSFSVSEISAFPRNAVAVVAMQLR